MAGLGALIFGALLGGSTIKCGIENAQMMSKPTRYLDDGTPVYLDRLCHEHINGEKVVSRWTTRPDGSVKVQQVGERSGKVYFDPDDATKKRMDSINEKQKQEAILEGKLAYMKYDYVRKKDLTCEISTGKFIAYLEGKKDGTYWKYYLSPNSDSSHAHCKTEGDTGVQITKEEFDKLNIFMGTHTAIDYNRSKHQYYRHCGSSSF